MTSHARKVEPVRGEEPIRLFRSAFLEFFTHIHPAVVVAIWLPVVVGFVVASVVHRATGVMGILSIPLGLLLGLFLWTC